MSRHRKKKHSKKFRRTAVLAAVAAAAAGVLIFWGVFYIRDVEVVGNTRYTEEEIREMVMDGFLDRNSVYLSVFRSHIDMEDVPFLDYVDVEYLGRDRIRLIVTEKNPIGYISLNGTDYYFDQDGVVLEAVSERSALEPGGTGLAGNTPTPSAAPETADTSEDEETVRVTGVPQTSGNRVEAQPVTPSDDSQKIRIQEEEFSPSLSDLPLVTGLGCESAAVGEKLSVADDSVFNTILALDRMIEKYEIRPDSLEFTQSLTAILHYGDIRVNLGEDSGLEEKMIRVAAILPKLEGKSGVLHLEDYTEDTQNILFSQDEQ